MGESVSTEKLYFVERGNGAGPLLQANCPHFDPCHPLMTNIHTSLVDLSQLPSCSFWPDAAKFESTEGYNAL